MNGPGAQHRAQRRRILVGVRELQVVAGHRLVDGEVVDRARVVFAQEGIRLRARPCRRDRRHRVESLLPRLERPGESQYASATPCWNSGIAMISSGSSGTVTMFFSRTKLRGVDQRGARRVEHARRALGRSA